MKTKWIRNAVAGMSAAGLLTFVAYKGTDAYFQRAIEARVHNYRTNLDFHVKPSASIYTILSQDFSNKAKYLWRLKRMEDEFDSYIDEFTEYLKNNPGKVREITEPRREYSGTIKRTEKGFQIIAGEGMSVTDQTLDYINEFLDGNFVHKNEFLLTTALYDIIFSLDMSEKMPSVIKALEYDARYEQLPESRKKQLRNSDTIRKLKETALISRRALEGFRDYIVSAQTLSGVNYNEIMGNERFFSDWHNHPINFSRNPEDYGPSKTDVAGSFTTGPKIVFVRVDGIAHAFAINRGHVKEIYTTKID